MLDRESEKFLYYIIKNQVNNEVSKIYEKHKEIGVNPIYICDICKSLEEQGYISAIFADDEVEAVILHHKGSVYFENKKAEKKEYIKQFLLSKISDIIVSAIVAYLTVIITG